MHYYKILSITRILQNELDQLDFSFKFNGKNCEFRNFNAQTFVGFLGLGPNFEKSIKPEREKRLEN